MNEDYSKYQTYARKVLSGEIIACRYVKLACQRYLNFFDNPKYEFRPDKADKVVNFIQKLKHFTGKFAGKRFILEEWQLFLLYQTFGFYIKGTEERMTKHVILDCGRKQGKSFLAASIGLYMLIGDGEEGSEVDCIANSRDQAHILYSMAVNIARGMDPKQKHLIPNIKRINYPKTKSFFQVLSSDVKSLDGYNSYCYFVDEMHASVDTKLYDVLASSQGMRTNPLSFICTTAGYNLSGPYFQEIRRSAIDMLEGIVENDSLFVLIYCLDEGDDYKDENNWYKSSPNLDITVTKNYYRDRIQQVKTQPSVLIDFLTKNMNRWIQSKETWIQDEYIMKSFQKIDLSDFKGEECYIGVDLSAVSDLTAVSLLFPPNPDREKFPDKFVFKSWSFLPEESIEKSPNREFYKKAINCGHLIKTSGNCVDYDYILNLVLKINEDNPVYGVYYDQYNATQWAIDATEAGLPMQPYAQGLGSFNRPSKDLERLILSDKVVIDGNVVVRWNFQNVVLKEDYNSNIKPIKSSKDSKIDCVIAMIQCLGGFLVSDRYCYYVEQ